MNVREKLLCLAVTVTVLAYGTHEAVLHLRPKPLSTRQIGLEWLRQEYKVTDAAYQKIVALHQDYFIRCDEMCATMERAHRPLIQRSRRAQSEQAKSAALQREKALCENCLDNMVHHLRAVAALMPSTEGERFLKDILPEVINPPELQKLRSQVTPLQ